MPEPTLRRAGPDDAQGLADLERDANLVALRHVFDPALHAFPVEAVLARWRDLLADPDVQVEVVEPAGGSPVALLAHDVDRVRHLAVLPEHWRRGLGGLLLDRAVARIRAGGHRPVLWCLVENRRARELYERRGWTPTGVERAGEFAPYPREMEYGR